jgi:hypothetical protein
VLCNLLQTWKIQAPIFDVWMEVLRTRLRDGVLVLWEQVCCTYAARMQTYAARMLMYAARMLTYASVGGAVS